MVKKVDIDTKSEVFALFLDSPKRSYHLREVARIVAISPRTAKKYLAALLSDGLLIREKEKIYENYRANRQSLGFKDWKTFHTIRKLRGCGVIEFLESRFNYPAIILYGSASRGEDDEGSDIDLFVVTKTREKDVDVSAFSKKFGRTVHIMLMEEGEFQSARNKELLNNVINGAIVSGFMEAFK